MPKRLAKKIKLMSLQVSEDQLGLVPGRSLVTKVIGCLQGIRETIRSRLGSNVGIPQHFNDGAQVRHAPPTHHVTPIVASRVVCFRRKKSIAATRGMMWNSATGKCCRRKLCSWTSSAVSCCGTLRPVSCCNIHVCCARAWFSLSHAFERWRFAEASMHDPVAALDALQSDKQKEEEWIRNRSFTHFY